MFYPTVSLLESAARSALVYVFLLVLVRVAGKKEIGRLTPMEFLGILLVAHAVGPAMNAGDTSLAAAAISAATLLGLMFFLNHLVYRVRWLESGIEGKLLFLIDHGEISREALAAEKITHQQLISAIRAENVEGVEKAYLEPSGRITVVKKNS